MINSVRTLCMFTVVLLFVTLNAVETSYAQTTLSNGRQVQGWAPVSLTQSGQNIKDGVEAFCQHTKFNGEDVVLLKLINHNAEAVTIEWNSAFLTKDLKWVSNKNKTSKQSLTLNANETVEGECAGKSHPELVTKMNDFTVRMEDIKSFGTTFFQVVFIKK